MAKAAAPKDLDYHAAAVEYNKAMMEKANELVETLDNQTVKNRARGMGHQFRHHMERHQRIIEKATSVPEVPNPVQDAIAQMVERVEGAENLAVATTTSPAEGITLTTFEDINNTEAQA